MKGVSTCAMCLAVGLWLSPATAEERPAVAALGRPSTLAPTDQPARRPIADAQLTLVSHRPPAIAVSSAVARGQISEAPALFPLEALPPRPDEPKASRTVPAAGRDTTDRPSTGFAIDRPVLGWIVMTKSETPAGPEMSPPSTEPSASLCEPDAWAPPSRFYVQAEYLLWWSRATNLPPLVTTGTPPDAALPTGALGRPDTRILLGGSTADYPVQSGARFTFGLHLDSCEPLALETTVFFLGRQSLAFDANSGMFPVLARPFFNLNLNSEDIQSTAFPGESTGGIHVSSSTRLWGAEVILRSRLSCGCSYNLDLLVGPRYLDLSEDLQITESIRNITAVAGTLIVAGTPVVVSDRFQTRNQFAGAQLGTALELRRGPWSVDLKGKIAFGDTHQTITIEGNQVVGIPNALPTGQPTVVTIPGGLLALSPNIGRFRQDRFSVVPEISVNVGFNFTDQLRAFVGYDFLYWSDVVRPGDQVDRRLDASFIPNFPMNPAGQPFPPTGLLRPTVPFKHTDYWAQGLNFGVEFRF